MGPESLERLDCDDLHDRSDSDGAGDYCGNSGPALPPVVRQGKGFRGSATPDMGQGE